MYLLWFFTQTVLPVIRGGALLKKCKHFPKLCCNNCNKGRQYEDFSHEELAKTFNLTRTLIMQFLLHEVVSPLESFILTRLCCRALLASAGRFVFEK